MPGLVTEWIMANCHGKLNGKTLSVMARDIDEAKSLGMECDVQKWRTFREWIRQEEGE